MGSFRLLGRGCRFADLFPIRLLFSFFDFFWKKSSFSGLLPDMCFSGCRSLLEILDTIRKIPTTWRSRVWNSLFALQEQFKALSLPFETVLKCPEEARFCSIEALEDSSKRLRSWSTIAIVNQSFVESSCDLKLAIQDGSDENLRVEPTTVHE